MADVNVKKEGGSEHLHLNCLTHGADSKRRPRWACRMLLAADGRLRVPARKRVRQEVSRADAGWPAWTIMPGQSRERPMLTTPKGRNGESVRDGGNTRSWPNAGSLLVQRRRRWTNIEPILGQRVVFSGFLLALVLGINCRAVIRRVGIFSNLTCHSERSQMSHCTPIKRLKHIPASKKWWPDVEL